MVTFGLNALNGRTKATNDTLWEGKWDSSNARDFINHTISRGYNVDSWEFGNYTNFVLHQVYVPVPFDVFNMLLFILSGNELSGAGVNARVDVLQYSKDLIVLKALIDNLYQDKPKPMILAPGGFFDKDWFAQMLQVSGPNVVDVVTHHIYDLGPGQFKDLVLFYFLLLFRKISLYVNSMKPHADGWC